MSEQNLDWSQLVGFETESLAINNLVKQQSLPPVILFHGREGIGKSIFVSKVCSYVCCETSSACGHCPACHRLQNNKSPALLYLDASAQKITSQDISKIQDHLLTFSGAVTGSKQRVLYLKDAESLTQQNVNKLLKIFEELPEHCHIFLSTSRRFSLLPTLRSRCVEFLLLPPSIEESKVFLKKKITEASHEYTNTPDDLELEKLLQLSRGSLGLTLHWLKQKESSPQLADLFKKLISTSDYKKSHLEIDRLKRDQQISLEELIQAQEIALNKAYKEKQLSGHQNFNVLVQKRKELRQLKSIIVEKKIKLNKAFVLESLILV